MLKVPRALGWACLVSALAAPASAQTAPAPPASGAASTDPYFEFLRAQVLEARNDIAGAQAALERAASLDPTSAAIQAELAALALGRDDGAAARRAAEAALRLDPKNTKAHRVLGFVEASDADFDAPASTPNAGDARALASAIGHFEQIIDTPESATDLNLQFTLGRLYIAAGQFAKAVPVLQRVVSQSDSVDARVVLAQALADNGQPDEAVETLEGAVAEAPQLYPTLAQLYERAGRMGDAAQAYGKAVDQNPGNRQARLRWVSALLATRGQEAGAKAVAALKPLADAGPRDTRVWYLMSEAQRQAGDLGAAEAAARQVLAIDPAGTAGPYALAKVFEERHEYRQVLDTLQPVVDRTAGSGEAARELVPVLAALANAAQMVGAHDRAVAAMTRATTIAPTDPALHAALVQTHLGARQFGEAAAVAARAQAAFPDDPRFARMRARALIGQGKTADAVSLLETGKERFGDRPGYWLALADAYAEAQRLADAEQALDQAAVRFPKEPSIPFQRGAIYEKAKRYADAEQAFRRVLAIDAGNADALNYLGYMLAERGERLDEAVRLISRALAIDPGNPSYLDSLGWAHFKKGDLAQAERNLQQAAGVLIANSVVQDHFAQVLFQKGRYADAVAAWERALKGDRDEIDPGAIARRLRQAREKAGLK